MELHIITLHSIYNPGSVFQAFGLQKFLISNGYDAEIIDYRPKYSTVGKNRLRGYLRKILFFKNEKKVKAKYNSFIKSEMVLSPKTFKTFDQLRDEYRSHDLFIAGSDQLWNADYDCGKDPSYYLDFCDSPRKVSYATSVGKKDISEQEISRILRSICSFNTISVREKSTAELLTSRLGRDVYWVCDPVFLLDREQYGNMTEKMVSEKYAVVYLSAESKILDSVVEDIKKRTGYKIILIGGNRRRCSCDLHIKDMGPYDFLSLIKNSELVISSSFHATAFSHIFHKNFGVILPSGNGERIESLLSLTGLSKRIIHNSKDISNIYEKIDYSAVDASLDSFIAQSKQILLDGIKRSEQYGLQ